MRVLGPFGPFTDRNDRFPYPFDPFSFIYMKPEKKGNPFWARLLCLGHYREYPGQFEHNRSFKMLSGGY